MNLIANVLANKHTTSAGAIFLGLKLATKIGSVWFPHYKEQLAQTSEILEGGAVFYGLAMAGDASKGRADLQQAKTETAQAIETGNTEILTKPVQPENQITNKP